MEVVPDLIPLYNQVRRAGNIQDVMDLSNFLNPQGENDDLHEGEISRDLL
jgi:hypothetical protein